VTERVEAVGFLWKRPPLARQLLYKCFGGRPGIVVRVSRDTGADLPLYFPRSACALLRLFLVKGLVLRSVALFDTGFRRHQLRHFLHGPLHVRSYALHHDAHEG